MTRIKDIIHSLEAWAPPAFAESYDNVGLLVGDCNREISGVLVSLDCTEAVVNEAIEKNCNLILSHHPILFKGLKKLTGSNYVERTIARALKNDIALYAIHTNLDSVETGVNKRISDLLGLQHPRILSPKAALLEKIVFFVPQMNAEVVRQALFEVGAGEIGKYAACSFNVLGEGTFTPRDGANPAIGKIGVPHSEKEVRVELMFYQYLRNSVIATLKNAHPYEEVAYYIQGLENENQTVGSGMIGEVSEPQDARKFLEFVKEAMGLHVLKCTNYESTSIKRVAVCGGAGSFLLSAAKRAGADIFITSDFKYHEFFDADNELIIADIGHYESERFTVNLIGENIRKKFSTFATHLTEVNTNPIHYI